MAYDKVNSSNICDRRRNSGKSLDTLLTNYDKVFLMGDFNTDEFNIHIKDFRRSHRRCSVRKGVLRNFVKFTGKPVPQPLF